jgi:hypothetical protein
MSWIEAMKRINACQDRSNMNNSLEYGGDDNDKRR